ncbi:hypothetical protein [Bradyrhizobium diazoefficiens]|uniref:hypothetical protein n=1 Tax=Bradyrhizobium diazoefficiens TaxID=1355477 RepID=UPI0004BB9357|nr:hypothetical protein [Bradyrhizobium diazoefficiens]AND90540.1 hypothetical protein AAV28_24180 [Bradyrhizobium diazoefficiens USDA 110]PDT58512.1 hypothetical protein CO678_27960 [Bradyrhizobium diazoefficiens]QBP24134.1 hypothetical protein Bdiaspc4_28225 [Bradyrhizobium diazoefficiens]QLD42891.1 hypothetical protein HUW42_18625 [Bradyrhizobium diazoefficiens]WLB35507.1 hypothetical protein QIH78_29055 [Bradyrhizobium diazoefficiens]
MKQNIPEEFPTGLMDWSRFVIKGSKMPPRDPDDDEEDQDEDEEGEEEGDDDEPAVVREPDED